MFQVKIIYLSLNDKWFRNLVEEGPDFSTVVHLLYNSRQKQTWFSRRKLYHMRKQFRVNTGAWIRTIKWTGLFSLSSRLLSLMTVGEVLIELHSGNTYYLYCIQIYMLMSICINNWPSCIWFHLHED
jgi:hypothetical protein